MKYEKPEVTVLASAANAVRGGKGISLNPDNPYHTVSAYEADE